jgi:5'-methylthioadenosine phosphorylase
MSQVKIGLVGGTGLGGALAGDGGRRVEVDTPFGRPSDAIIETQWEGHAVLLLSRHGPGHLIPPSRVPFRANIFALKKLGCTHIIAGAAVGSLRQEMKPGDLAVPDQLIDRTTQRQGSFFEQAAVHVEFAEPFCPVLRRILLEQRGTDQGFSIHERGCYVCVEGPAFSTRAESLMHRLWGGDLIGMTAMPEARLAREAEISYALVAMVTDYDCWKPPAVPAEGQKPLPPEPSALLKEITANLQNASSRAMDLIRRTLRRIAAEPQLLADGPAQHALELAIWSDKTRIPQAEIARLAPLWGKYFS